MNQLEFARIHEMQFHGDIRFHLRLHEMTKEPLWPEPVPPHWHEEYEFLVITRGTGTACLNTRTMHIEPGDILFINAGIVHSFRGDEIFSKNISAVRQMVSLFSETISKRMMLCGRISKNRLKKYVLFAARKWQKMSC